MIILHHQDQGDHALSQGSWSWRWDVFVIPHLFCLNADALCSSVPTPKKEKRSHLVLEYNFWDQNLLWFCLFCRMVLVLSSCAVSTLSARQLCFHETSSVFVLTHFTSCTYFGEHFLFICHLALVVINGRKMLWAFHNTHTLSTVKSSLCDHVCLLPSTGFCFFPCLPMTIWNCDEVSASRRMLVCSSIVLICFRPR